MVVLNPVKRELTAKIVYYGPGLCGKTTNLHYIYESMDEGSRGKMLSLSTETDRTLFFDFLPLDMGEVKGFRVRVQLYTVPGQVFYEETRKRVLKGADGIVFVADSQRSMFEANRQSFAQLTAQLKDNGIDPESLPIVLQFNKRDLPEISTVEELDQALNPGKLPFFEAIANEGVGVEDTLRSVTKQVLKNLLSRDPKEARKAPPAPAPRAAPEPPPEATVTMDRKKLLSELGIAPPAKAAKAPKAPAPQAPAAPDDLFDSTGESPLLGSGEDLSLLGGETPRPTEVAEDLFAAGPSEAVLLEEEAPEASPIFEDTSPGTTPLPAPAPQRVAPAVVLPPPAVEEADLLPPPEEVAEADVEAVALEPGREVLVPITLEGRSYVLRIRLERADA